MARQGADADFTDLHAWAEVYLPGAGWIGLDPTSGLLAGEGHIPLAATPDRRAPRRSPAPSDECEVDVRPRDVGDAHPRDRRASPSRTPTSSGSAIDALGPARRRRARRGRRAADDGRRADVRVDRRHGRRRVEHRRARRRTSGGSPARCCARLRDAFAPGALLHFGQGKWYPGESLPRWALGC